MTNTISTDLLNYNTDIFNRVHFIMVSPSHPGNVGSAARAIKTMGFNNLHLVAPGNQDILHHPDASALASGAQDILENCKIHTTLSAALAPSCLAFALTARPRAMATAPMDIRQAAETAATELGNPVSNIAFVLGTEKYGLSNEDAGLCQHICHIPANPGYSSLNVSQALQLAAWEMRYVLIPLAGLEYLPNTNGRHDPGNDLATNQSIHAMFIHLEQAMIKIGFLDPQHPKKLLPRIQNMFNRNHLSVDEVAMLRGLCTAMIQSSENNQQH